MYVKSFTIQKLEDNIVAAIGEIPAEMLKKNH